VNVLRRVAIAVVLLAFVAAAVLVARSLVSYDWQRQQTEPTNEMPETPQ